MDLIYALIMMIGLRHNAPAKALPMVIAPSTVRTIPDPLPYVLDESFWGPAS